MCFVACVIVVESCSLQTSELNTQNTDTVSMFSEIPYSQLCNTMVKTWFQKVTREALAHICLGNS